MKYDVLKPFSTVNRRLKTGGEIADNEIIEPWTFEERAKSGFLKPRDDTQEPAPATITPAPVMAAADTK